MVQVPESSQSDHSILCINMQSGSKTAESPATIHIFGKLFVQKLLKITKKSTESEVDDVLRSIHLGASKKRITSSLVWVLLLV